MTTPNTDPVEPRADAEQAIRIDGPHPTPDNCGRGPCYLEAGHNGPCKL